MKLTVFSSIYFGMFMVAVFYGRIYWQDNIIIDGVDGYELHVQEGFTSASPAITYQAPLPASITYVTSQDLSNRQIDKTLEVGSLPGTEQVGQSGDANYSIPISLPDGITGHQPALNLSYNSSTSNGLFGLGWMMNMTSMISRTNSRSFFSSGVFDIDPYTDAVDLDNLDRFSLDGQRLQNLADNNSNSFNYFTQNAVYHTYGQSYRNVESYGLSGSGPEKFQVRHKNGRRDEYGYTTDSRHFIGSQGDILNWYLNKSVDKNGNVIEYTYTHDAVRNCTRLDFIEYGKNENVSGSAHFAKIEFVYGLRDDIRNYYIAGTRHEQPYLVTEIIITVNNSIHSKYHLSYSFEGESRLANVQYESSTGAKINSTAFEYCTKPSLGTESLSTQDLIGKLYPLDVNGDGFTDFISEQYSSILTGTCYDFNQQRDTYVRKYSVQLYINQQDGTFITEDVKMNFTSQIKLDCCDQNMKFLRIKTGDFDGDGKGDFMILHAYKENNVQDCSGANQSLTISADFRCEFYTFKNNLLSLTHTENINHGTYDRWSNSTSLVFPEVFVADLNDDGRSDVFFDHRFSATGADLNWSIAYGPISSASFTTAYNQTTNYILPDQDSLIVSDFTGDGKVDILNYGENGSNTYTIYSLEKDASGGLVFNPVANGTLPNSDWLTVGDFNGDGKADLLLYEEPSGGSFGVDCGPTFGGVFFGSVPYNIHHFTGVDFVFDQTVYLTASKVSSDRYDHIFVADVTGDGLSDIIQLAGGYNRNCTDNLGNNSGQYVPVNYRIYYDDHQATNFVWADFSMTGGIKNRSNYTLADIDGDGGLGLYNNHGNTDHYINFFKDDNSRFLKTVSDGYGKKTSFAYGRLTNPLLYTPTTNTHTYPFISLSAPLPVVSNIENEDGLGGVVQTSFTYEGLIFEHRVGILGLERRTSINAVLNLKTIDTYGKVENASTGVATMLPIKKELFRNDAVISEVQNSYQIDLLTGLAYGGGSAYLGYVTHLTESKSIDHQRETATVIRLGSSESGINVDQYGNVLKRIEEFYNSTSTSGSPIQVKTTESTGFVSKGAWCLNLPIDLTETQIRGTNQPYVRTQHFEYFIEGNIKKIINDRGNQLETFTSYTRNSWGNLTSKTRGGLNLTNRTTSNTFSSDGRFLVKFTNELNQQSDIIYNSVLGVVIEEIDPNNRSTTYQYDNIGRQTLVTKPGNFTTSTVYEWVGSGSSVNNAIYKTLVTSSGGVNKTSYYDILNREIRTESQDYAGLICTTQDFNNKGQLTQKSEPHLHGATGFLSTSYSYDLLGRLAVVNFPNYSAAYTYNVRTTTVKNTSTLQESSKTIDATNLVTSVTDMGGTIDYDYHSSGMLKEITAISGPVLMEYDLHLNRTLLDDPDAGTIEFEYDGFDELKKITRANGQITEYDYDKLGRRISQVDPSGQISVTYDPQNNLGALSQIEYNDVVYNYLYDPFGNIEQETQTINGNVYQTNFEYNSEQRVSTITYPSGLSVEHEYDQYGNLTSLSTSGLVEKVGLWSVNQIDSKNRVVDFTFGNSIGTELTYDSQDYGYLNSWVVDGVLSYEYNWDVLTGNLLSREEQNKGLMETFTYDDMDRLKSSDVLSSTTVNISYDQSNNGNITFKSDAGEYVYSPQSPHAISELINSHTVSQETQHIEYNAFNKVSRIKEGKNELNVYYGPEQERKRSESISDGILIRNKYYVNSFYEEIVDESSSDTKMYNYVYANGIPVALIEKDFNNEVTISYLHTDYLGSIIAVTDDFGQIVVEQNFDAWGRQRDPQTWDYLVSPNPTQPVFDRGFTFHEHLENFGLINMNGRLYDPLLARFLSPDPYVQAPYNSQNYNRYSYVLNNPLKYSDPSGEIIFTTLALIIPGGQTLLPLAIHMDIGWMTGAYNAWQNNEPVLDGALLGLGIGAVNGGLAMLSPVKLSFGSSAFGLTLSPIISVGSDGLGAGINANVGFEKWGLNAGVNFGGAYYHAATGTDEGVWEGRIGYGIGYERWNTKVGIGSTYFFSGETSQQTGQLYLGYGNIKITYDNDTWAPVPGLIRCGCGPDVDKFRTVALSLEVTGGKYEGAKAGFNIFTGEPNNGVGFGGPNGTFNGPDADRFRLGALYVGYKTYRLGYNSESVIRAGIQNGFHDIMNFPRFRVLDIPGRLYYGSYSTNPYSLW